MTYFSIRIVIGLIVTAGWDKRIKFWDTRSAESVQCMNVGGEVEAMSLSGFHLMIAVGTSVSTYDLRTLSSLAQAKESFMDIRIKCVRPILGFEGTVTTGVHYYLSLIIMSYKISLQLGIS